MAGTMANAAVVSDSASYNAESAPQLLELDRFDATVTVGINNVFDVMPPASYANAPINFDMYTYDVRGRSAYVRLGFQF